jgi:transcriptional regulator with XRE-family HTH domain
VDGKRKRFAANLSHARRASGISQEELGARTGLHRTEVSLLERGGREPRLGILAKLAASLDTTIGALCAGIAWSVERRDFKIDPPPKRKSG